MDKEIETPVSDTTDKEVSEIPTDENIDLTEVPSDTAEDVVDLTEEAVPPADEAFTETVHEVSETPDTAAAADAVAEAPAHKRSKYNIIADIFIFAAAFFIFICILP